MARLAPAEVFAVNEVAVVHVLNRTVRQCFLPGPLHDRHAIAFAHEKS